MLAAFDGQALHVIVNCRFSFADAASVEFYFFLDFQQALLAELEKLIKAEE